MFTYFSKCLLNSQNVYLIRMLEMEWILGVWARIELIKAAREFS